MARQDLIGWLIRWLNEKTVEEKEERRRVRAFLALMQDAQRLAQEIDALPNTTYPPRSAFEREFQLDRKINGFLKNYPVVQNVRLYPPRVVTDLELLKGSKQQIQELGHIQTILRMAEGRSITDIRECNCGKLFMARSSLTRFCSPDCRIAFWENSEERKQRKRERAREYYMLHKAGIVKSARKPKTTSTERKGR
jgi:hypothetical protein